MNIRKFSSKLKVFQNKNIYVNYTPYLFTSITVIVLIVLKLYLMVLVTGVLFFAALILRIVITILNKRLKDQPEKKSTNWKELRKQLTQVLSDSKILLDTAVELKTSETSTIIFSEEQVNGNFFEENEELIKATREIGIDGLLCLMFLIQQQPAIASVRAIQKSLKIPLASAYRHLQKMSEFKLVVTYFVTEKPGKVLYRITDEGSSLIIKLYELIGGSMLPAYEEKRTEFKVEA